jgi:1,4-alpha-glucan branching enzyme
MYTTPGKKLLFMGDEFGQWREWHHDTSLDWHLLGTESHRQLQHWVNNLNHLCREETSLHQLDFQPEGFEWVDSNDSDHSVISFLRKSKHAHDVTLAVCNFTPLPRFNYRVGVPLIGVWREILNSDAADYGGSGLGNLGGVKTDNSPFHGRPCSLNLTLPPLAILLFKHRVGDNSLYFTSQ